jgi:hypothetical protein
MIVAEMKKTAKRKEKMPQRIGGSIPKKNVKSVAAKKNMLMPRSARKKICLLLNMIVFLIKCVFYI